MGKIVISENVSLDGVVQDPTGDEGFRHGGWFSQVGDKDREEWAKIEFQEALGAEALLLGRRSDEYFGTRWTGRSGEWADRLNSLPKYVVSSTLVDPEWSNSTVLKGDVVNEVSKLKQELDGQIVVYASRQLVHTLMEHDLVDELRLMVYPFVLGAGERLFGETSDKKSIRPSAPGPSGTASSTSPTRSSETPDRGRCSAVVRRSVATTGARADTVGVAPVAGGREDIFRGLAVGESLRAIAARLGRGAVDDLA
jgi:dihydrofolate reductase